LQIGIEDKVRLVRKEEYGYLCAKTGKVQSFDQLNHPCGFNPFRLAACKHESWKQNGTMDAPSVSNPVPVFYG
jgi:hypothetical protein